LLLLQTGKPIFPQIYRPVKIEPNSINGLNKASAIDTLQLRGVDLQRFIRKLGSVSEITMLEIIASIATVIEFEV
jgi:mRNA interferase MazF